MCVHGNSTAVTAETTAFVLGCMMGQTQHVVLKPGVGAGFPAYLNQSRTPRPPPDRAGEKRKPNLRETKAQRGDGSGPIILESLPHVKAGSSQFKNAKQPSPRHSGELLIAPSQCWEKVCKVVQTAERPTFRDGLVWCRRVADLVVEDLDCAGETGGAQALKQRNEVLFRRNSKLVVRGCLLSRSVKNTWLIGNITTWSGRHMDGAAGAVARQFREPRCTRHGVRSPRLTYNRTTNDKKKCQSSRGSRGYSRGGNDQKS